MNNKKKIMIIAGGTGGHIFPGLSIANYFIKKNWDVYWLGSKNRMEFFLVTKNNIHFDGINIHESFFKKFGLIKKLITILFHIWVPIYQARKIIQSKQPDIVLCLGNYISFLGGISAWSCNIPIVVHEQNSIAGIGNKFLSKIAKKVLKAYPNSFPHAKLVGNPIRESIISIPSPEIRFQKRTGPIRVLVIGGSQGSNIFNQVFPNVIKNIKSNIIILWHQIGFCNKNIEKKIKESYLLKCNKDYRVFKFIDNIAYAYAWADVIICHSGALTVSEIQVVGLFAIFVPYLHKDRHQYWNAYPLMKAGVAKIIEQKDFTVDNIINILMGLNRCFLLKKAKASRKLSILNSVKKVYKEIKQSII